MKAMRKGFTLVELMVVIVIIGILAALAIPRFLGASNKAKASEFKPVLKQIYTLQEAYKQEKDSYASDINLIAFDAPKNARFSYSYGNDSYLGKATYIVGKKINNLSGNELTTSDKACIAAEDGKQYASSNDLAALTNLDVVSCP